LENRKNICDRLFGRKPDMMCLSKALTGGTIPMAITTFTQELFDAFMMMILIRHYFTGILLQILRVARQH
jgi:adenosylmethionine-8-amino-7-oxononanoate aminotransferase